MTYRLGSLFIPYKSFGMRINLLGNFHTVLAGVFEVNPLTVQRGGSVTIPYFYEDSYKTDVKYWCRGSRMSSCTPIVRTDSPKISGEVSIRDDPDQRVFTVTINNVKTVDSGDYWCGVEISRGGMTGRQVYLSVIYGKMSTVANEMLKITVNVLLQGVRYEKQHPLFYF
uniref:Immunoglobulin domain-containing protein n=1 Tax=Paramormyrops kingsleyae TaxID=1676925 RepID=A0A3B3SZV6_9TELE